MAYYISDQRVSWFTYLLWKLGLYRVRVRIKKVATLSYHEKMPGDPEPRPKEIYFLLSDGREYVAETYSSLKIEGGFRESYDFLTGAQEYDSTTAILHRLFMWYLEDLDYPSEWTEEHRKRRERLKRWGVHAAEIQKLKDLTARTPQPQPQRRQGTQGPSAREPEPT